MPAWIKNEFNENAAGSYNTLIYEDQHQEVIRSVSLPNLNDDANNEKLLWQIKMRELKQQLTESEDKVFLYKNQNRELQEEVARFRRREQIRSKKCMACLIQ